MNYTELKNTIAAITGFCLPEQMPEIGVQTFIDLPNPETMENPEPAYFLNLGDSIELFSKATNERYSFKSNAENFDEIAEQAQAKRQQEAFILANEQFGKANRIDEHSLKNVSAPPKLTGVLNDHEDYLPAGVCAGELREANNEILQPFYSFKTKSVKTYNPPVISCIRNITLQSDASFLPEPDSHHLHRLVLGEPVAVTLGYENSLKALNRLSTFNVMEMLNMDGLVFIANQCKESNFIQANLHDQPEPIKGKEVFFALTLKQYKTLMKELERVQENDLVQARLYSEYNFSFIQLEAGNEA